MKHHKIWIFLLLLATTASACAPSASPALPAPAANDPAPEPVIEPTPYATRPPYAPGELVDYTAQPGDTLPALAARFNTTEAEIRTANPVIPLDATTMPPGFPMKIPIYYEPLWGSPYQILPDWHFVNGPAAAGFNTGAFVAQQPGWLNGYVEYAADANRTGAQIVDYVSQNFSLSPRLLLALLEYQSGALSDPQKPNTDYYLGERSYLHRGLYLQLVWAANTLNNGYYAWRLGDLTEYEHPADRRIERPDPWQNAATVAMHYYFSRNLPRLDFTLATGPDGFAAAFSRLFGNPWENPQPHIPASLQQPYFLLPFEAGKSWNYTGGPHTGWGKGEPYAAIDFAPSGVSECNATDQWVTAMAQGIVARSEGSIVELDLDGDGDTRTGWVLFYLHVADQGRAAVGRQLNAGDPLGHASCEGGESTGTHVHIARKYNGEWLQTAGVIPFEMEGWVVKNAGVPYKGSLVRFSQVVIASDKSERSSLVTAGMR